jgi:parallel beta-helix repeat protein
MATSASAVAGSVIRVPDDFAALQGAVNAAQPGDVIRVAAGTCCERVVITTSDLRIEAAPAEGTSGTILTGTCSEVAGLGYGFLVQGTAAAPVTGVEISGFVVEGFETGFALVYAAHSRLHGNEARFNALVSCSSIPGANCSHGIVLQNSTFNEITENSLHDNGHLGIGLRNGSSNNLVRGNRLYDNQTDGDNCSLMLWGTANADNQIVEDEVVDTRGRGIMIGPGPSVGNVIAQNRVHGHPGAGIIAMGPAATPAYGNFILQNDARGNATDPSWGDSDLVDLFAIDNVWLRNLGTCAPASICGGQH